MISRLECSHIPEVAKIEELCFSEPWSAAALELLIFDGAVGFVCVTEGRVAAYGGMMHVLDEGQITNIATHPDFRRRGYAAEVLCALCDFAVCHGLSEITLEVRASNSAAISLYSAQGFLKVGERRGFYRRPTEDAIIMKKTFGEA